MTIEQARALWDEHLLRGEGYLDAQVRLERERGLTDAEQGAADVIWRGFVDAMKEFAAAFKERR